ncbi:MAG: hypothetical protein OER80_11255 [Gammaproteobacteria bacterium]|nr:hypothetical protein [Gammaproteobacteria bacterium]MDH3768049.1 hypothetical protein [Gammaproteobacteria bacterium]
MRRRLIMAALVAVLANYANAQSAGPGELYQAALEHMTAGEHDAALDALEKAAATGFTGLIQLQAEGLRALRENPRFKKVIQSVRNNTFPCEKGDKYDEFDFWLGTWDVYTGNAQKAGTNNISRAENGCVLVELWTGTSGVTGRSLNYYDPNKDKWRQHWVSATGLLIDIEGNLVDGSMVLEGKVFYPNTGLVADFRGTWTLLDDGRVRQFFEQHDAETGAWNSWFEGFYERISE